MSKGRTLIKNSKIVSSKDVVKANILIEDGIITAITNKELDAEKEIDAKGRYVIPGAVDGHTHMMDPGKTQNEDFTTGTQAAAVGGITTAITHHRTIPPVYSINELEDKIDHVTKKAVVDFGIKGGGAPDNIADLEAMWKRGVTGFKAFTCDLHGSKPLHPGNMYYFLKEIKRLDATLLVHCENESVTEVNEKRLKEEGRKDNLSHIEWRSLLAEKIAVEAVINVAKETGARVVIAHVSHPDIMAKIKEARDEGYSIYAEGCPHYFNLTLEMLEEKGPWVKFTPPMRMKNQKEIDEKMWPAFNKGYISLIGSDHCPYPKEVKEKGLDNIWDAPNGIPGVETSMRLMINAVNQGKTTINKVVELMSENPAQIYGLYPKKGTLSVGSDADLVILDMETEEVLKNENVVSKCGWTPYEGKKIKGVLDTVMVRGELVARRGKAVGKPGYGQFVSRAEV
ncbi:MAG: dihydroorotase [Bacillota bacterium]